jgi:hypothetical protein
MVRLILSQGDWNLSSEFEGSVGRQTESMGKLETVSVLRALIMGDRG